MHTRLSAVIVVAVLAAPLVAQSPSPSWMCANGVLAAPLPGSIADENTRARGIREGATWSLTRASTDAAKARMLADSNPAALRVAAVLPELIVTSQRAFPLPANDGPMWAGKGLSYSVSGGIALCGRNARWGAIIAPTYWSAENADFPLPDIVEFVPPIKSGYSRFASPYHYLPRSLDQPRRFGDAAISRLDPGSIAVWFRAPRVEFGFTTESEWWGPGQNNALILSSQAAGAPRVYARTSRPLKLAGDLDARVFLGALSYSPFFKDPQPADSGRSLAGLAVTWRPRFEPGLTLGVSRLVASPTMGNVWVRHLADPIIATGTPNAVGRGDSTAKPGRDQLFSVFGNWRLRDDGTEIWFEWARAELPTSLADFLASPNHTQALTLGLQHVQPMSFRNWTWRVGAEHSQTNQSSTYRERPTGSWYTSRAVPGGFSQRGQVLGAMIGPGSVTQRLNLDFAGPSHSLGLFAYRIKWDDDAFYTIPRPIGNGICKHDVSLAFGVRGTTLTRAGWFEAAVTAQNRLNLYWQAIGFCWDNSDLQIDQRNTSIEFRFHPRIRR